ncbi:MAG: nuclease-related domain-containing protein, partial [Acidimicrobiales bacterium]
HDRGAAGEEQVGAMLEQLTAEGWRIVHDASFGRGNVDHILIGPGGVFTIETKSHPGPIRVGRVHGATLAQALSQQKLVARVTDGRVQALLVYSRAWVDRPLSRRKGVRIVPARMLIRYLSERRPILDQDEIDDLYTKLAGALMATSERPGSRFSSGQPCPSPPSQRLRRARPASRGGRD